MRDRRDARAAAIASLFTNDIVTRLNWMPIRPSCHIYFRVVTFRQAMISTTVESAARQSVLDCASAEVQEFVARKGLGVDLHQAAVLACGVFDMSGPMMLSIEEDPDTGESWVEMSVAARGSVESVMKAHETYSERLRSLSGGSCREIRLFLHIARD